MTEDIETLKLWIHICLIVAALGTTAFPLLYSLTPWRSTMLGQLVMLQAAAFALAIDLTLLFQFWTPDSILLIFWVNAVVFNLIAISTTALTWAMWRMNRKRKE